MTATATRPRSEADVQAKEKEWAPLLIELHDDLERMRTDGTPAPIREAHERAYGRLHAANVGLRDPETAARLEGRYEDPDASEGERAMLTKCEAIQKADHTLSAAQAFREAMKDPDVLAAYYAESGTQPVERLAKRESAAPAAVGLAKVESRAEEIQKREGVSSAEAYRRAMRDPAVAAEYARGRGGVPAAA